MSKVKKMKLVPIDQKNTSDTNFLIRTLLSEKPTEIVRINVLDDAMRGILESNHDEDTKLKLFTQTLNKYLFSKIN